MTDIVKVEIEADDDKHAIKIAKAVIALLERDK